MDNKTKAFAQKIVAELERVEALLHKLIDHLRIVDTQREQTRNPDRPLSGVNPGNDSAHPQTLRATTLYLPSSDSNQPQIPWYKSLNGWKTALEVVAIPFAIGYAAVTYLQWRDAHRSFTIDQRAWLRLDAEPAKPGDEKLYLTLVAGQPVGYAIKVQNVGKTAAKNITARVFVDIVDSTREPPLEHVKDHASNVHNLITVGIVFPSSDFKQMVTRPREIGGPRVGTADEISALDAGRAYLAVYGIIEYQDIFDTHHWTKFCRWIGKAGTFAAEGCTRYNNVDNN